MEREQILEEHEFCFELAAHEISVVAPLSVDNQSLFTYEGYRYALFPRQGGHAPDLSNFDQLETLGRTLGRIHRIGGARAFAHRPRISVQDYGPQCGRNCFSRIYSVRTCGGLRGNHARSAGPYRTSLRPRGTADGDSHHGDFHGGNVLWRGDAPHFVDFDDARTAPAVQDIWMCLSGEIDQQRLQLDALLEGYTDFHSFDSRELGLIEPLRTLRMLHFSAWWPVAGRSRRFSRRFPGLTHSNTGKTTYCS